MTEIIAIFKRGSTCWLMLDCGHWLKWTGARPKVGSEIRCPNCNMPTVTTGPATAPKGTP